MKKYFKRVTAGFVALLIAITAVPIISFISADEVDLNVHVSDSSTLNGWTEFFGDDKGTENAGGVWVDKSVLTDSSALGVNTITLDDEDNFHVALSAIASTKSITGYAYIPTDTVFVLDISGSMFNNIDSDSEAENSRAAKMIEAANDAIKQLLENNEHNRVGIILYSTSGTTFLPLDRYSVASETDNFIEFEYDERYNNYTATISTGATLKDGDGDTVSKTQYITGGTYIQIGMDMAGDMLTSVEDTEIEGGEFQAGVTRMPIIVAMSDGAPTYGTTSFTDVTTDNRSGNGQSGNDSLAFVNQLTAIYTMKRVEEHYGRDALMYTLGVGVAEDDVATSVLNPSKTVDDVLDLWETYDELGRRETMSVRFSNSGREQTLRRYTPSTADGFTISVADINYVDRYFSANTVNDITTAFDNIVDQIIIQSKYYPTDVTTGDHHLDGDITIQDQLGEYMEVKQIEGILVGTTLYSGEAVAHALNEGDLGTVSSPTPLGDELSRAVQNRVGVDALTAQQLIDSAYNIGQLHYDQATDEYSNYIGWYADEDGNYVGFWNGNTRAAHPEGAAYINRSYLFLGTSGTGINASDMMYLSVQVHTRIDTGVSQVLFKIPAALIPLITYSVDLEGTSYENAKNIVVTRTDADPIRLVYEVGLLDTVNEITVKDIVGDNYEYINEDTGVYSFYTNRWEVDSHIAGEHHPSEHINTVAYYAPSQENERYYYTEDTLIYSAQDLDSVYTGETAPTGGTYYRAYYVFSNTPAKDGIKPVFVEISPESLAKAQPYDDGTWYIPMGVIHTTRGNFYVSKGEDGNPTDTYAYVREPVVATVDGTFYATAFLGNNGLHTVVPAQGLKISKTVDEVEPGTSTEFTFTIENTSNTSDNTVYRATRYSAAGVESTEEVAFVSGKASVKLNNGERIYILDLAEGDTFTVAEEKHDDYRVKSVTVDGTAIAETVAEVTIAKQEISEVDYVNTYIGKGLLVISKTVAHELGSDYILPESLSFDIAVDLGEDNAGKSFATITEQADGTVTNGTATANANGVIELTVAHGTTVAIDDIDEGTVYTVTEDDYTAMGFVTEITDGTGEIVADDNSHVYITNTYDPDPADASVLIHSGTKAITGRDWLETDEFSFIIEKFDGSNYSTVATVKADANGIVTTYAIDGSEGKSSVFSFTDYLSSVTFDTVGEHVYRVREVAGDIGGITYTTAVYDFTVTVSETTMTDGKLEITNVESSTAEVVYSRNNGTWEIITPFTNTYKAGGSASITLNITKEVQNEDDGSIKNDISLEGYQFGVYDLRGNLMATLTTDATGVATATRYYTFEEIGSTFEYVIRELDTGVTGVNYSDATHSMIIEIYDKLDGTVGARVYSDPDNKTDDVTFTVDYVNTYKPLETSITLEGTKTLTGRDMIAGEFDFVVTEGNTEVADGTNDADGKITFTEIEYTEEGEHTYVITETDNGKGGVKYDENFKTVVVNVTDVDGQLVAEIVSDESDDIAFENEYETEPATVIIEATKHLTGKTLEEGEFDFLVTDASGNEVDTATNAADGSIEFRFTVDEVGTHIYTITEIPSGVEDGITYDTLPRQVSITVTDDGNGQLVAEFTHGTPRIIFANTYLASGTSITFEGRKNFSGRDLESGEFNFYVYDEEDNLVAEGTSDALGNIIFTPIPLNEAGTFEYTIVELNDGLGGVTYDDSEITVTVTVTDNGDGQLTATGPDASEIVFTNSYKAEKTSIILEGTKTLTGRDMIAEEFDFVVMEGNTKVADGTNDADGKITFTEIEYTEAGDHTYVITEVDIGKGGVTYDDSEITVTVSVTDDGHGNLVAEVTSTTDIAFTNTYELIDGTSYTLEGEKELTGRDINEGEFIFRAFEGNTQVAIGTNDADGKITFSEIEYTEAGTHTYRIIEGMNGLGGITYDTDEIIVVVNVVDNGDGTITASVDENSPPIEFQNSYGADDASIEITATKVLTGARDMEDGEFSFTLEGEGITRTATNDAYGHIVFDEIEYTQVGEYTYTVTEDEGTAGGVTYDTEPRTVIVNVTDDGEGNLVATISPDSDELIFNNTYTADVVTVTITVNKELHGRDMTEGEFEFIISENGAELDRATNATGGTVTFEFTEDETGEHTYVVSEVEGEDETITYDGNSYEVTVTVTDNGDGELEAEYDAYDITFDNTYTEPAKDPVPVEISGEKKLEGRDITATEFRFILNDSDGGFVTDAYNLSSGAFKVEFEIAEAGTFTYTLIEDDSEAEPGMDYDESVYDITVVVEENADGELEVIGKTVTKNGEEAEVLFENSFTPIDNNAYVTPNVSKTIEGRDLNEGEFSFEINGPDGYHKVAVNDINGVVAFEKLVFPAAGEFIYTISEVKGGLSGVTYDESVYTMTVNVTEQADGKMLATVKYTDASGNEVGGAAFKNTYKGGGIPGPIIETRVKLIIKKELIDETGLGHSLAGFVFNVTNITNGKTYTAVSNADGYAEVEIVYTPSEIGNTYVYHITEMNTGISGMQYDETVHEVVAKVGFIPTVGLVTAQVTKDGEVIKGEAATFVNTYSLVAEDPVEADIEETEAAVLRDMYLYK